MLVIVAQPPLFQWSMSLFLSGIIVTALGFALPTKLLWDSGERTFSYLALIVSLFGVVLLVIYVAFWLGVNPLAGQETATTGVVPAEVTPFRWMLVAPLHPGCLLASKLVAPTACHTASPHSLVAWPSASVTGLQLGGRAPAYVSITSS